mmetsp:Transcript_3904/g.6453  ORF Transcript_3904/g.6453 Transcript_3904/m.6453 type:complete len:233 (-) Transcript_3904:443-1141(-)
MRDVIVNKRVASTRANHVWQDNGSQGRISGPCGLLQAPRVERARARRPLDRLSRQSRADRKDKPPAPVWPKHGAEGFLHFHRLAHDFGWGEHLGANDGAALPFLAHHDTLRWEAGGDEQLHQLSGAVEETEAVRPALLPRRCSRQPIRALEKSGAEEAPAGLEHAGDLREARLQLRPAVKRSARVHRVDRAVAQRQRRDIGAADGQRVSRQALGRDASAGLAQHRLRVVERE